MKKEQLLTVLVAFIIIIGLYFSPYYIKKDIDTVVEAVQEQDMVYVIDDCLPDSRPCYNHEWNWDWSDINLLKECQEALASCQSFIDSRDGDGESK